MGNCCVKCLRLVYRRRVLRQYTALDSNTGPSHEAEDLFDEDDGDGLMNSGGANQAGPSAITENEKLLLSSKNYAAIISSQRTFDDQIDKQLAEQEEKLRREEDEINRLRRSRTLTAPKTPPTNASSTSEAAEVPWSGETDNSEWNVAGGEDDFDMFLESVAARDKTGGDEEEINEDDFVSGFTPSSR